MKDTPNKAADKGRASTTCSRAYVLRAMKWILHPLGQGTMSDFTTEIEVDDEGAGEFLVIRQPYAHAKLSAGGVAIDPTEWPALRDAIESAFTELAAADSSENVREQAAPATRSGGYDAEGGSE
jgi:hypothetical protein